MKKFFRILLLLLMTIPPLLLTSCGPRLREAGGGLRVLATTTFLADMTRNVVGDRAQVESILPVGADPHAYQVTPTDVAKVSESDVLIQNGLEYEHFLETILENADGERIVITATDGLTPREADEHGAGDPHMWLDPTLVIAYVENIRAGMIQADPAGEATYRANADAYIAQLKDLDAWIRAQVESIPAERRLLVTNHESLGYFAERYGFAIVETILTSFSSDASASAKEIAAAVDAIKTSGAPAIFLGDVESATLANQIASETGAKVIADLHLESLTDGAPAATYIEMMKYNVSLIVEALK
ncbi:MAG: zinc ABC transporter substrate-binding protein [Chloroflexi bacterium]|nr:zinc ABC transporter substrate-binding protein [Chloroflexota bacterium]